MSRSLVIALALLLLPWRAGAQELGSLPPPAADAQVFEAMQAEMTRSLKRLKVDDFKAPYYLAYRLVDEASLRLVSAYGAAVRAEREEDRTLYVEARVGDETLDNTDLAYHGKSGSAAVEPQVLRHHLWSLTDEAYKAAVAGFLEKKAKKATELDRDKLDDLSREPAYTASTPNPAMDLDGKALRTVLQAASGQFKRHPWIHGSYAYLSIERARRYLLTSEGTRIASPYENAPVVLVLSAWTRAEDGMRVDNRRSWAAQTPKQLPPLEELLKAGEALAKELKAAREAPLQPPLSAPAIVDPEFAGVLFHEALGHKLEGQRQRDPQQSQVFKDLVGKIIIPGFLSLIDDPTMAEYAGAPLHGHYDFDAEGV
ncbi:MAG: hypothetical protein HY554_09940, partial [Elusimicrobia bacterium]|nr:hypothetical protein [Elusimicrobiota bacterium]